MKTNRFLCILVAGVAVLAGAQTPSMNQIKRQKQTTQQEIKETSQKISQNKNKTRKSLNSLNRISADIKAQEKTLTELTQQVAEINIQIDKLNKEIEDNNKKLNTLLDRYLNAIQKIRSHRTSGNKLMFLFSAESFHQAYRRMRYLKEFSRWRESRTKEIKELQAQLEQEKAKLVKLQEEKNAAISKINQTKLSLETKRTEQDRIVKSLQAESAELQQVLREKEQQARALDQQ